MTSHQLIAFFLLFSFSVSAQTLLRDINETTKSIELEEHFIFNGELYFFGELSDSGLGFELYKIDLQQRDIQLIRDITIGFNNSSVLNQFSITSDRFFFLEGNPYAANNDLTLMVSDGTEANTKNFIPEGLLPGFQPILIGTNEDILIAIATIEDKISIWATNGDAGDGKVLHTFDSDVKLRSEHFIHWGNLSFFITDDGLWRTDGTEAGTYQLLSYEANGIRQVRDLTAGMDALYFWGEDQDGISLWKTDGTPENRQNIGANLKDGGAYFPDEILVEGNELYFATGLNEGFRIWKSDGTEAGTQVFSEMELARRAHNFTFYKGDLYCTAFTYDYGMELVSLDADGNPKLVKDIVLGTGGSDPKQLIVHNNYLLFSADDKIYGAEWWATDGTTEGTNMVVDLYEGDLSSKIRILGAIEGNLIIHASDQIHGQEIWEIPFNENIPTLMTDANALTRNSRIRGFRALGEQILFLADDGIHGKEWWKYDLKTKEVKLIKDINPGLPGLELASANDATLYRDELYFIKLIEGQEIEDDFLLELWKTDGTAEGTKLALNLKTAAFELAIENVIACNDHLFIIGQNLTDFSYFVWVSQGDSTNTEAANLVNADAFDIDLHHFACIEDALYFSSANNYLYKTQDNPRQIEVVEQFDNENGALNQFTSIGNGRFVFTFEDREHGREIWVSDGKLGGTHLLKDINPGPGSSSPENFYIWKGQCVFTCKGEDAADELWVTDGTEEGTKKIKKLHDNHGVLRFHGYKELEDQLFFLTEPFNSTRINIWKSDGTEMGTQVFHRLHKFAVFPSFFIEIFTTFNNQLYFHDLDDELGYELWQSDGTLENTKLAMDLCPGPCSSYPMHFFSFNDQLFFYAYSVKHGREPWLLRPSTSSLENTSESTNAYYESLITVHPNPIIGDLLHLNFQSTLHDQPIQISLRNISGQTVLASKDMVAAAAVTIPLPENRLPAGTYIVSIQGEGFVVSKKVVVL